MPGRRACGRGTALGWLATLALVTACSDDGTDAASVADEAPDAGATSDEGSGSAEVPNDEESGPDETGQADEGTSSSGATDDGSAMNEASNGGPPSDAGGAGSGGGVDGGVPATGDESPTDGTQPDDDVPSDDGQGSDADTAPPDVGADASTAPAGDASTPSRQWLPRNQIAATPMGVCALTANGELVCWGGSAQGVWSVPGGEFSEIVAYDSIFCALADGAPSCFEAPGEDGEVPAYLPDFETTQLALSGGLACGVDADGNSFCREFIDFVTPPVLDAGVEVPKEGPLSVPEDVVLTQLSTGARFGCGIRAEDGEVQCWGETGNGEECGGATDVGQLSPAEGPFEQISSNRFTSCGLRRDGSLACWGAGTDPEASLFFCDVQLHLDQGLAPSGTDFARVSVSRTQACAIHDSGAIECWGLASQVFNPETEEFVPRSLPEGPFDQVSVSDEYACAMRPDRRVECWGSPPDESLLTPPGVLR